MQGTKFKELEVEDEASGDAGLVLGGAVETGEKVVDLDGTEPDVRDDLEIDAGTDSGGEGVDGVGNDAVIALVCNGSDGTGGDGLMRAAKEDVREWGDARGKGDFGTDKASVLMNAAGAVVKRGTVVSAEIGGDAEEGEKAIRGGKFETVEVAGAGDIEGRDG